MIEKIEVLRIGGHPKAVRDKDFGCVLMGTVLRRNKRLSLGNRAPIFKFFPKMRTVFFFPSKVCIGVVENKRDRFTDSDMPGSLRIEL